MWIIRWEKFLSISMIVLMEMLPVLEVPFIEKQYQCKSSYNL